MNDEAPGIYANEVSLIILWDIDHTLIENAGVSKEIYAAAFHTLAGVAPSHPAVTEGRTDRLIMRDLFHRHGKPEPAWPLIEEALARAGKDAREDLVKRGWPLPGASAALTAVAARTNWVSSVLTGNIAANAQVKLSAFGLDRWLDMSVGAYGADALQRTDLVEIARTRIRRDRGAPPNAPLVLIGDTPRDVEAALAARAEVIAVATGTDSEQDLMAAGANHVLPSLANTERFLTLLSAFASG
ncbi:HAD family hydrolase [Actinoplanes regularis]|uniref:Phosphoglycolate phosphatase, HAD superfamily n=1 Tax=Actinoplanes regularis TaxID=52697 RepID=A0A238XH86_9ACTN|nr:haloacid dehalogenase-like hydrolase [Actinoplanes regularis]GIE86810.1 haloacid dehalogenase [Actinoplanes regularis]SNR58062.1 Phosphoglycolate phosphatase, HAD superfamily [Actinoplanes regularis]